LVGDMTGHSAHPGRDPADMLVFVLNAGSSSLKASLVGPPHDERASVAWGSDASRAADRSRALEAALDELRHRGGAVDQIEAIGHRVVHGGERFTEATPVDDTVAAQLRGLNELAPLHNPVAIEMIEAARRRFPGIPHVVSFDTAFHRTLPTEWRRYPVPDRWFLEFGVRRYGFHGLSVAWSTRRAAELLAQPVEKLSIVVAHLGNGCSVTAVRGGRSVATSMGMTPLEGLMMGTRAGSIDPGAIVALLRDGKLTVDQVSEELEHASGLLGVSGSTSDMRTLAAAAEGGDKRAGLAIEMFVVRAAAGIAASAASLQTLGALVFTGGIGENASRVRGDIVSRLAVLGFESVGAEPVESDAVLSKPGRVPAVLRIEAREDLVIAADVRRVVGAERRD
jgi:acetate kinase